MIHLLAQWSNALAAALFAALALWQARRDISSPGNKALFAAFVITAATALIAAMLPPDRGATALTSGDVTLAQVRHLGWLGFLYLLWRTGGRSERSVTVGFLYLVVATLFMLLAMAPMLAVPMQTNEGFLLPFVLVNALLHILSIVGALVLVHNLYSAGSADARDTMRLPLIGIAAIWIYDLNLYTIAYLSRSWPTELFALQGLALALSAPLFAFSIMQNRNFSFSLSRSATFQSVSLFTIGGYLVGMVLISAALEFIGGEQARIVQIGFVFAATMIALVLAPSPRFRAWFRVKVAKHFFQHRYDYRSEWLRFTDILGQPGDDAQALNVRVVQAIADIVESPSGVLLVPNQHGALLPKAEWNWPLASPPPMAGASTLTTHLELSGRVIDCDKLRQSNINVDHEDELDLIPEWILNEDQIWSLVPLLHFGRLAGVIVLTRPYLSRTLDWEDFDLLRTAGRQVASYLAEARGQDELAEARRFDEFNRRFAFIMHDIKNLVSQLTLLTRNAERHADNPDFRADMIETLKNSTARMNALLARLSQHNKGRREEPSAMLIADVARRVVAAKKSAHPVVTTGDFSVRAIADPARLEQALLHLVQNAIEASAPLEPVTIRLQQWCNEALIEVIDRGVGMSASFIHDQLFKPFTSTKEGGFGIGTFEARAEILSMGGTLDVHSEEGMGTTFSISLPIASEHSSSVIEARELAA